MTTPSDLGALLRSLTPPVLGAVARRAGDFADAEDAVQEALVAAATAWPTDGVPDNPFGWLVRVATRRLTDQWRSDDARRRREERAAARSLVDTADPAPSADDSLILLFLCCHPELSPGAAIPLCLRAVGGLTTREIAAAFLVPEATMAQRISRAKARVRTVAAPFALPTPDEEPARLRLVLHVLYLMFNEGYVTSSGVDLARADLAGEAIRLARLVHASRPDDPEAAGLLALMLLTEARRDARTGPRGELVPLAEQDRRRWRRPLVTEGLTVLTAALGAGRMGEYQLQAAIAGVHAQAISHDATEWWKIAALYERLEAMTDNPMVTLNRAVAVSIIDGPDAGLAVLDGLDERLGDHHRLHSVRAHLLERAGRTDEAIAHFVAAASRTANQREQQFLTTRAAGLRTSRRDV